MEKYITIGLSFEVQGWFSTDWSVDRSMGPLTDQFVLVHRGYSGFPTSLPKSLFQLQLPEFCPCHVFTRDVVDVFHCCQRREASRADRKEGRDEPTNESMNGWMGDERHCSWWSKKKMRKKKKVPGKTDCFHPAWIRILPHCWGEEKKEKQKNNEWSWILTSGITLSGNGGKQRTSLLSWDDLRFFDSKPSFPPWISPKYYQSLRRDHPLMR